MKKLIEVKSIFSLLSTRTIRIVLAIAIFMSMTINSFVPKAIENRENVISIMGAVISNVIVETFKECTDTLTAMSNKITKDLYKILSLGEVGTDVPVSNGQKEKDSPVNTSSDSGIEIENRTYRELVSYSDKEGIILITEGKIEERLYRLYNSVKVYCSSKEIGIMLFFILFIVTIRNRKEDIIRDIKVSIRENKTNLC